MQLRPQWCVYFRALPLLGDDGIVYFIDPLVRLHHSAAETIRLLTGVDLGTI